MSKEVELLVKFFWFLFCFFAFFLSFFTIGR